MQVFVFLHVLTMFTAVALGYGAMIWLWLSVRARDLVAVRGLMSVTTRYGGAIPATFLVGVVLGVLAIFLNDFDPLAPWLLIAYVLIVALMITGSQVLNPWLKRVAAAVKDMPGDVLEPMPAPFTDRRSLVLMLIDAAMLIAIIFDMVVKPFS